MNPRSIRYVCLLAAVGFLPSFAAAGVVPISRDSLVKIEGQVITKDLSGMKTFTKFGTFNDAVGNEGGDPQATYANGSAWQNTSINPSASSRISGNCILNTSAYAQFGPDSNGDLFVDATTELTVVFQITDHPELFALKGSFQSQDIISTTSSVRLTRNDPPAGQLGYVFSTSNAAGDIIGGGLDFDAGSGQLPVGTYTLFADSESGSSGTGRGSSDNFFGEPTGVNFTFSVGEPAQAIPLPPAVWPGFAALAGVLGRLTYRRRTS